MGKLVIVSQVPPPVHGSSIMTQVFLRMLDENHVNFDLVDKRFSRDIKEVSKKRLMKLLRIPSLLNRFNKALNRKSKVYGSIFFISASGPSLIIDFLLILWASLRQVKVVLYVHTSGFSALAKQSYFYHKLLTAIFKKAYLVVALSNSLRGDLPSFLSRKGNVRVIPNTVFNEAEHLGLYKSSEPKRQDKKQILFLSNMLPEKGALDFVEFGLLLLGQGGDYYFQLAGGITDELYLQEIRSKVREAGQEERFTFLGPVLGASKLKVIESAVALVFPSRYKFEAQPLTVIEAMSLGTPTIAYDVGSLKELLADSGGMVTDEASPQDILRCFNRLVGEEYKARRQSAHARYLASHSNLAYAQSWNKVLTELGMPL